MYKVAEALTQIETLDELLLELQKQVAVVRANIKDKSVSTADLSKMTDIMTATLVPAIRIEAELTGPFIPEPR